MNIETANLICYSPTRTTITNLQHLAEGMGLTPNILDLTLPDGPHKNETVIFSDIALIGVPVYAGRVAPVAAERLKTMQGNNTPAVVVVVYGNRHYDGALTELADLARKAGFRVVAGAALVGEHSFSSSEKPIAAGRPDDHDKTAAARFGAAVKEKLMSTKSEALSAPLFPGDLPEGPYAGPAGITPEVDPERCTLCGLCAEQCPTGAITVNEAVHTDAALCTLCCACVKACPKQAVRVTTPAIHKIIDFLYENCQARREPEFFI